MYKQRLRASNRRDRAVTDFLLRLRKRKEKRKRLGCFTNYIFVYFSLFIVFASLFSPLLFSLFRLFSLLLSFFSSVQLSVLLLLFLRLQLNWMRCNELGDSRPGMDTVQRFCLL